MAKKKNNTKKDRKIPIWTTLPAKADEFLNQICKEKGWKRPEVARNILCSVLLSIKEYEEKTGADDVIKRLYINPILMQVEKR